MAAEFDVFSREFQEEDSVQQDRVELSAEFEWTENEIK